MGFSDLRQNLIHGGRENSAFSVVKSPLPRRYFRYLLKAVVSPISDWSSDQEEENVVSLQTCDRRRAVPFSRNHQVSSTENRHPLQNPRIMHRAQEKPLHNLKHVAP